MTDSERIEWLEKESTRLVDVYWRLQNENETLREAIDQLMESQRTSETIRQE